MTKIRQLWDLFVQAECSSYEKSTWCDLFLCQFLADLDEGLSVEEILTFCNWSGVGTLIGCELLSDIDQVCSQPGTGEELAPLRHHLYTKGWKALAVLLSFGQQNFSCSNELANLLISLYPICLETKGSGREPILPKSKNKYLHIENKDQVDACFSKSPLKNKFTASYGLLAPRTDYFRSHSNASNSRNRRQFRGTEVARLSGDIITSESENPSDDFDLINKSCALKIKLNPMDFDYFTSVVRSDDDARLDSVLYQPRFRSKHSKKIMPADFIDDKIESVMKSRVSPYEFSMLVIRLLTSLCRAEQSFTISSDNSYPVCTNSVKFSIENLCSLQFGSVMTQSLENHEAAELKSGLTQLLIISLEKVMGCPDITSNVILTGILPMMLKVLEDSVCKLSPDYTTSGSNDESAESYEREKQQEVVFGLICSLITFLFSLLMQSSDVDRVKNFLELFKIFIESSCGKLIEKTILALSNNVGRAKKVIDLIGQLVSELKEARKKMVYPHFCKKSKHKRGKGGGDELHHHLDLFGAIFTAPLVGSSCQQNCCVSSLFMVLVRLLKSPDKIPSEILHRILKIMTICGTCCCFPTKDLIQSLAEIIKLPSQKSRALVFQLLENTIYAELGAYATQNQSKITCVICFKHESDDLKDAIEENIQKRYMAKDFMSEEASTKSEKSYTSYQSDGSLLEGYNAIKSWLKLELFRELILSSDFRIVHGVTCHLLKCAPKMNKYAKFTILFKIFFPTFLTSKAQFLNDNDEVSIFRILSSLSIFSSLLSNTQLAEQFISQRGLNHVLDLISIQAFSKHCCLVLEKTINIGVLSQEPDLSNNSALLMLRRAVDNSMSSFFEIFNMKRKSKLLDLPNVSSAMGVKRKMTVEHKEERDEKKAMDALQSVSTFWRTYANLALCSPVLRKFFSDEVFLTDCNDLLKISLTTMTKGPPIVKNRDSKNFECSESHLFTRLIESLLSFILATSEHSENGDGGKKVMIEKLSETLLHNDLQNVDVRRLADVLLKCSLLQPSQNQIVPSISTPKLPTLPIWTTWAEDVPELEDSEVRTASDSSSLDDNYVTADEGYEADVEIRDNPTFSGETNESNSCCSVTDSITLFTNQEYGYEKNDFKNFYTIVHPQLCHLAIDLLVKLYQDKLSDESRRKESRRIQHSKSKSLSENFFDLKEPIENSAVARLKDRKLNRGRSFSERSMETSPTKTLFKKEEKSVKMSIDEKNKDVEGKCMLSIISTFQRLVSLCRDKSQNCDILCQNGVILKLLTGFGPCLSLKNEKFSELQRVILDLITVLAKHSITTQELITYLSFFKEENPPVDFLLNPLVSLVTSHNPQPNFFLRFPVSAVDDKVSFPTPDIGKTLHLQHKREGIPSCWSCAAVSIPVSTDLNWSPWSQGFSLSMWLRVDRTTLRPSPQMMRPKSPQKQASRKISKAESHISACSTNFSDWGMTSDIYTYDDLPRSSPQAPSRLVSLHNSLHIFSIGQENVTLECWTATTSDTLLWRLTRVDPNKGYEILAESVSEHCLPSSAWHHFTVNVKDYLQRKKTILHVTLIVNGWREVTVLLSFSGLLVRKSRPSSLLLGHQSDILKENCSLANVMVFTNPVFTREKSVYLLGLGPNCNNLTDCQVGRRNPNFTSVFGAKTLTSDMAWDSILDEKENNIRELQNHLLLTYSAENPNLVNFYPPVSNPGSLFPGFRPMSSELTATQQEPIAVIPNHLSQISSQRYQGLIPSATLSGGSATFLFLFARVVELSDCPEEQAKSLFLLLKLVQSDCDLFSQFVANDHHKLLHKVFSSSKCISGLHILKAILDACCDKPIIEFHKMKKSFQILEHSDAVIVNSFLISTIISSWKDWSSSEQENEVLEFLFAALQALLKDDHPHREFNVSQLNRVRMVDELLSFCKERLLYEEKKILSVQVCKSLVELIRSLMGSPPEFSHVVAVMDCLILLHPVNATYITHVKNSFYLLLSAGQTYSSQAPVHEPKPRTQSTNSDSSKSSHILDNWIFNFNFNSHMKKMSKQEFTQPVDPAKLNKALTNLQLKQSCSESASKDENRKHLSEDLDSNRYSDELTLDSGIAGTGSYREQTENVEESDEIIVKAVDGSKQNLTSFFPSILTGSEGKASDFNEVSDEEEKYTSENNQKEIQSHDDCGPQCLIMEGLLLLLRNAVSVLPDNMAHQVLNHVVRLEALLVMANHKDHRVRSAVVKVICAYMQRCSDEEINKFIRIRGFHHLANQISLFPASSNLVEDCLHLITKRNIPLVDLVSISEIEFTPLEMASLPPLLALLPRSVHDSSLARNLLNILKIIYCKDANCARVLLENGLLEVLVKALVSAAHVIPDENEISNQNFIVCDIHCFFTMIVNQVLNTPGIHNMQIITDIRLELNYVHRLEKEKCGVKSRCVRAIREVLCKLLEQSLDIMQDKITSLQLLSKTKPSSFFSVLSKSESSPEADRLSLRTTSSHSNSNSSSSINNVTPSNLHTKEVSRGELSDRFRILIVNAIEFLIYSEPFEGKYSLLSQIELNFIYNLLPLLLQILSSTLEKRSYGRRPACNGIHWAVRDTLKTETAELLVWLLSPRHLLKTRIFAINCLMSEPKNREVVSVLLLTHAQIEQKFIMFLWDLMYNNKIAGQDLRSCQELKESLQSWGIVSSQSIGNIHDAWGDECNMLVNEMNKQMAAWEKQTEAATMRCITKHDALIKGMGEEAMSMTRTVVDSQNSERKSLMEQIKLRYSENIQMAGKWNHLISQLTHEKAVWFFKKSYPMFWQLDPTEGPSRVRKRLSRCHINIDERYLLPSQRHKLDSEKYPAPLSYLFEKHKETCTSTVLIERLHCNEKIRTMTPAKVVTPANEIPGELLIGETCLYFVAENRKRMQSYDAFSTAWSFEDVKEIHNRRYQLQERAIEIFLINGKTYLIAFQTSKERDALMAELLDCNLPNRVSGDNLADVMQLWREGLITNWDYLTQLNKMAGRSFNDLMQYPVFPFVLSDYTSSTLDLTNPGVYRNFKKPMAVQDKKNEQHYINNYNELLGGLKQVTLNKEPYHYGSHYSNSGTVLHFLVRLPPFTKMLLQYQDRNFDLPDRTFHSMHTTWRLASCDSTTDVKEMLPEFFYLPEFLLNSQGFNFGVRQNGEIVDDVELPPWCRGDARNFILIHRQALESDYATENLPHWIDLVFGHKQTGKAAVEAINVFHPATYCGFDVESISDPLERMAWETMVKTYGQTPRQLFRTAHPLVVQSLVSTSNASGLMINEVKGLKWGNYVGSPAELEPTIVWKKQSKDKSVVWKLLPLISNDVFGLPKNTTSLLRYNKEKGLNLVNSPAIRAALVSWGHSNGIVRLKVKKEQPAIPLVYISQLDPISVCESAPECNQLWIGHSSGNITVYKCNFVPDRDLLEFSSLPTCLQGHCQPVVGLSICRPFSIAVSAGQDGTIIIWDLNHISYVRSIELSTSPLKLLTISDTLGDIATVSQGNEKEGCESILTVHTINANFVASTSIKGIATAICYSAAAEGISINVIACGLSSGVIRLFSSWDLTHVRDIISGSLIHPVVSLAYSYDAQHLYASFADGTIVVWEGSGAKYNGKTPKFLNLASLK